MHRRYFYIIIAVAIASLLFIVDSIWKKDVPIVNREAIIPHPSSPYKSYISGVGIVEASSGNIFISTPMNRTIDKILVTVGMKVKHGDILFQLENRDLIATLLVQEAAYQNALARLHRLEAMPRSEDLASSEALLKSTQAEVEEAKAQHDMVLNLSNPRAISQEERNKRLFNYQQAQAKLQQAQADLNKIKLGTWKPDLEIARLAALQARAHVESIKIEIERTIIRSPIDGEVLQIKIHEGESPNDLNRSPLMIIGNTDQMYVRVSINQFDVPFFSSKAPAVAYLQGDAREKFPLSFVRIEPYLVSKQNLNNEIFEKVDTRVLQIIYSLQHDDNRVFVGQQMDAFIDINEKDQNVSETSFELVDEK